MSDILERDSLTTDILKKLSYQSNWELIKKEPALFLIKRNWLMNL